MSTYDQYQTDESAETEVGRKFEMPDGSVLHCLRPGGSNGKYLKRLRDRLKPMRQAIKAGVIDDKKVERVEMEVFVETCMIGWLYVTGRDGEPLEYGEEAALQVFRDLPEYYRQFRAQVDEHESWRREVVEEESGNSPGRSPGG